MQPFGRWCIDNDYSFGTLVPDPGAYVDKLSSLNDMQVISEGMAEKIGDPKTKDAIADKMRQNGMPQSEIDAAWKRIDAVNAYVEAGKLRIVKDGEWGKGPNTIEALSAGGDTSIFQTIKRYVIETAKAMKTQKAQAQQEMKKTQVKEHALAGQGAKITEGINKQSEVKEAPQPNSPVLG